MELATVDSLPARSRKHAQGHPDTFGCEFIGMTIEALDGVFGPIHDHRGRPGTVYILQGTDARDHRAWGRIRTMGREWAGPRIGTPSHWLENRGTSPAVEISVDIVTQRVEPVRSTRSRSSRWAESNRRTQVPLVDPPDTERPARNVERRGGDSHG